MFIENAFPDAFYEALVANMRAHKNSDDVLRRTQDDSNSSTSATP